MTRRLMCAVGVVLVLGVSAQSPADQLAQARQEATARLARAITCEVKFQMPVERQECVEPAVVAAYIRQQFEARNPGKTLASDWAVIDKSAVPALSTSPARGQ